MTLQYEDARTADAITEAVSPDNVKTPPGLWIKTDRRGKRIVTTIDYDGKLATFIATIDDFLSSVSTAEKTVKLAERFRQ